MRIKFLILLFFILANTVKVPFAENLLRLSCVMHVDSTFSAYEKTPLAEIAHDAQQHSIDVIIPADHALMRWEYGLFPFRRLAKRDIEKDSILSIGPARYLREISRIEREFPEVMIIPGAEVAAYYFWTGSAFKKDLTLNNWHKHLMVVGLEDPADYERLPIVSNRKGGRARIFLLWPLLLLVPVFFTPQKIIRYTLLVSGLVLLVNNYPFTTLPFDQYHGDLGEKPYQHLIEYANKKGALTFWVHPESKIFQDPKSVSIGPALITTKAYPKTIRDTYDYTGFSLFEGGYREIGLPGSYWDQVLLEYCMKKREKPVWAIGEKDHSGPEKTIDMIQNILWVKERSKKAVLECLAKGNFYAVWKYSGWELLLNEFKLTSGSQTAIFGDEIAYEKPVKILLNLESDDDQNHEIQIQIIRNGALLRTIDASTPARLVFEDTDILPYGKNYYRIVIGNMIATNPIFVEKT